MIRSVGIFALHDDDYPDMVARIWIAFEHSKEKMFDRLLTGDELRVPFMQIRDQSAPFPRPRYWRDVDRRDVSNDARMFEPVSGGT